MKIDQSSISILLRSHNTVFTFKDIFLLWGDTDVNAVKTRVHYYVKKGELYPIRRGIYGKDKNYEKLELATKIFTPSYISFETVLGKAGITFQFYGKIFIASYLAREIIADSQAYAYKKIKDKILTNPAGNEKRENYSIASPERAFLDVMYLYKNYYFDNLSPLNWDKVYEVLPIYGVNYQMEKRIKEYHEAVKNTIH